AGVVMGYIGVGVTPVAVLAAMALPAFNKVRTSSLTAAMNNDARMIAAAAQMHFIENDVQSVEFGYDPATGEVRGPLATYVRQIAKGYTTVPTLLTREGTFELGRTSPRIVQRYNNEGRSLSGTQLEEN
ncbi:MAG TPA: hypothetical protein VK178_16725, partial [Opitutaceae bacterium]|nr:hypothetical protein [Opitutaceae bacterium]